MWRGGVNREGSGRTKGGVCVWWWGRGVNREGSGRTKGCVCVCVVGGSGRTNLPTLQCSHHTPLTHSRCEVLCERCRRLLLYRC